MEKAEGTAVERRLLPGVTVDTRPFWTGGAEGKLNISRCGACARYAHPPSPICPTCLSRDIRPEPVSGRGTVVSYTVNHEPWVPDHAVPYVVAFVEIEEQPGVWVMTNIVDCAVEDIRIGMTVGVRFERHDDVWLPMFAPAGR